MSFERRAFFIQLEDGNKKVRVIIEPLAIQMGLPPGIESSVEQMVVQAYEDRIVDCSKRTEATIRMHQQLIDFLVKHYPNVYMIFCEWRDKK